MKTNTSAQSPAPPSESLFGAIPLAPADPIFGIKQKFLADKNPNKVDLSAGVYQNDSGVTPRLKCVAAAEQALLQKVPGGYLPIDGHQGFKTRVQELVFGKGSASLSSRRIASVQAIGGTSALYYGARFVKQFLPASGVYLSDPTWENHTSIFEAAGVRVAAYPYYDMKRHRIDFDALLQSVKSMPARSVVLLHACCHNPTGLDLDPAQWDELIALIRERELVAFLDFAYQGFAAGLEEDAAVIRKFADSGMQFIAANSFSKNFSLYNRRVGALHIAAVDKSEADAVLSQVKRIIRSSNSNPPVDGAVIVDHILGDSRLRAEWEQEVGEMRERIKSLRRQFVSGLAQRGAGDRFKHVEEQAGMFSYTGLSKEQVAQLQEQFGIYALASGRISIASLTSKNIDYVLDGIAATCLAN